MNSCKFLSIIFLVLLCIFIVISLSILQSDAIFVLITGQRQIKRDQKRYRRTKNDITGHIVFMSPCYRPDKGTSV